MTPADLVRAALCHRENDRLPYNFMLSPLAAQKLRDHLHLDDVEQWIGSCLYFYGPSDKPLYADPAKHGATITDQWGVVWATSTIDRGYPISHPLRELDLANFDFPDPLEPHRWRHVAQNAVQPAPLLRRCHRRPLGARQLPLRPGHAPAGPARLPGLRPRTARADRPVRPGESRAPRALPPGRLLSL